MLRFVVLSAVSGHTNNGDNSRRPNLCLILLPVTVNLRYSICQDEGRGFKTSITSDIEPGG